MAKILKLGVNPVFGIDQDSSSVGAFLAESYSVDAQPKSVEITNSYGQKSGEVIYDQTLTYTYSGTLVDVNCTVSFRIGEEDPFATAMFEGQKLKSISNNALPFNCNGQSIIKNVSIAYNAGQVAKITVTGEHNMAGTSKA